VADYQGDWRFLIFWHAARLTESSFDSNIRMDRVDIVSGFWGSVLRPGNFIGGPSGVLGGKGVFSANSAKPAQ
jgi:hypothetical protein